MQTETVHQHTSRRFNEDLERVRSKMLSMGGLVEDQLQRVVQALVTADRTLGRAVAAEDTVVNGMELSIDDDCSRILATRAPTAGDLRMIVAIVKSTADLERIGDECQKLGYISAKLATLQRPADQYKDVERLGQQVRSMIHDTLSAFARLDARLALETALKDKAVDELHKSIQFRCIADIPTHTADIDRLLEVVWTVRSLERIGDHAKNICEHIIYIVLGKDVRHVSLAEVARDLSLSV